MSVVRLHSERVLCMTGVRTGIKYGYSQYIVVWNLPAVSRHHVSSMTPEEVS